MAVVALVAGAWFGAPRLLQWQQSRLAERLADRALAFEDGRSEAVVARIADLGVPGVEALVRLAASDGPVAAPTARTTLLAQLAKWEQKADADGDVRGPIAQLQAVADAINRHADEFDSHGQRWAQRVARRIVRRSEGAPPAQAAALLVACEAIFEAAPPVAPPRPLVSDWLTTLGRQWPNAPPLRPLPSATPGTPTIESQGPIGPPEVNTMRRPVAESLSGLAAKPQADAKAQVDAAPRAEVWLLPGAPLAPTTSPPVEPIAIVALPTNPLSFEAALADDAGAVVDVPGPDEMRRTFRRLRELSDRELLSRLSQATLYEGHAIREVLRQRGISEELLQLISDLEQGPATERRAALGRIGLLPSSSSRRLLRWFVADQDVEVRLEALSLLATSGDPRLPEIARQRAIEETDPRVAELAQRILREQR